MACRKQLLALQRQGRIVLPPARWAPPVYRAELAAAPVWPAFTGLLGAFGMIALHPVAPGTPDSRTWNAMMQAHHPHGRGPLCGAQLRYLIVSARFGPIGGLAVSAAA